MGQVLNVAFKGADRGDFHIEDDERTFGDLELSEESQTSGFTSKERNLLGFIAEEVMQRGSITSFREIDYKGRPAMVFFATLQGNAVPVFTLSKELRGTTPIYIGQTPHDRDGEETIRVRDLAIFKVSAVSKLLDLAPAEPSVVPHR